MKVQKLICNTLQAKNLVIFKENKQQIEFEMNFEFCFTSSEQLTI